MTVVGRSSRQARKLGNSLAVPIGRSFDLDRDSVSLGEELYLDVNEPHMVLICGKRGYGKSYTMGLIAEGLMTLPEPARAVLTLVMIDAMGVFWTMQRPGEIDTQLAERWDVQPRGFPINVLYPEGLRQHYERHSHFFHSGFQLYPSELQVGDWLYLLDIGESQAQAAVLTQVIKRAQATHGRYYSLDDLAHEIENQGAPDNIRSALERKLERAQSWGIFSDRGTRIEELFAPASVLVFDLSGAGQLPWNVRTILAALLCRRLYAERAFTRTAEEISKIMGEAPTLEFPLVWLFIDEAHLFAPTERATPATEPLLEWVRQGRRPGLSLVMASQQPGALDRRLLSQCDTLIVQRLTAGQDSTAIGTRISEIYDARSIIDYMRMLPKEPGYAIVLNDQTEQVLPVSIRPRRSWDGGGSARIEDFASVPRE